MDRGPLGGVSDGCQIAAEVQPTSGRTRRIDRRARARGPIAIVAQLVVLHGVLSGPLSARPTNAATAVPTPSIGLDPEAID